MVPINSTSGLQDDVQTLMTFFGRVGEQLLRPAKGVLPYPSISASLPGATYSTHLWDWDTYWTARGLFRFARLSGNADFVRDIRHHLRGSLRNFLEHQTPAGRVPLMMTDDEVDPFGCLTGGAERNQAKPIMAQIALLAMESEGDTAWLADYIDPLVRFLDSWARDYASAPGLLVWGNDVTIGVDNDPTTFGRPAFSSANILLNCLYYRDLLALSEIMRRHGDDRQAEAIAVRAESHGALIQRYCWDTRDRFFYSVDVQCQDRRAQWVPDMFPAGMPMSWSTLHLRTQMFTGFLPLWCRLATKEQAELLVNLHLDNPETFHARFGVRTLAATEPMFSLLFSSNPSNWLGPIWSLSNHLVWKGLKAYGFHRQAERMARATVRLLAEDLCNTGTLHEYYHPDSGEPLSHAGFLDWNLLVLEMLPERPPA